MSDAAAQQEQTAGAWSRAAADYSHVGPPFFQFFGSELIEFARIHPGAKVLDVATGRGALLIPAAEKVGPSGEVTGIDYSEGMVTQTGAEVKARGLENARVLHMSAEQLDFPDGSFDVVTCGFAIFFFPHPERALAEFRRVLKQGGKLVMSTWGRDDARWAWLSDLRRQSAPQQPRPTLSFNTPEALGQVLTQAGFAGIEVCEVAREFFYASPEEWWATQWSHGARIYLEQMPPEALQRAQAFSRQKMAEIAQPEGIPMLFEALFASAIKQ